MKIGILTFHRAINYGAVLQCYALQEYLRGLGHDVKIIDYRQPWIERYYRPMSLYRILKAMKRPRLFVDFLKKEIHRAPKLRENTPLFRKFCLKYLNLTEPCGDQSIPQSMDCYFVGSDQLWNYTLTGEILDAVYTGDFKRSKFSKVFGYAISATTQNIKNIPSNTLRRIVKNFDALSVRESSVQSEIRHIINVDTDLVLDPTLLVDSNVWDKMINEEWSKRKFVLLYHFRPDKKHPMLVSDKAKELAKNMNCELIDITDMTYTPEDFVSMFKFAKCVVTSSFHATAFSIVFKRPLYPVVMGTSADDRYVTLLNQLNLQSILVTPNFEPCFREVDYSQLDDNMYKLRINSYNYIEKCLSTQLQNIVNGNSL